ncbi:MAG: hypothetical protein JNM84_27195 [Planctomycetes bacterium]|nr:hypothetical protein [Planctomycetota bacterium]
MTSTTRETPISSFQRALEELQKEIVAAKQASEATAERAKALEKQREEVQSLVKDLEKLSESVRQNLGKHEESVQALSKSEECLAKCLPRCDEDELLTREVDGALKAIETQSAELIETRTRESYALWELEAARRGLKGEQAKLDFWKDFDKKVAQEIKDLTELKGRIDTATSSNQQRFAYFLLARKPRLDAMEKWKDLTLQPCESEALVLNRNFSFSLRIQTLVERIRAARTNFADAVRRAFDAVNEAREQVKKAMEEHGRAKADRDAAAQRLEAQLAEFDVKLEARIKSLPGECGRSCHAATQSAEPQE